MIIEQALHDKLGAAAALTALIGTRLYYVRALQDVDSPYVVLQKISAVREHAHDGPLGMVVARFQVSIFAETYKQCKDIAVEVQTALDGFTGTMGGAGGVYVGRTTYENEIDFWDENVSLFQLAVDYILQHDE